MKLRSAAGLTLVALAFLAPARVEAQKRPLDHTDYDLWNRIQNQRLSPDGRYVTYQLTPGEGDARVVVREARGSAELVLERGADARFTGDSRYLVAVVKPAEAAVEAAEEQEGEEDAPPAPKDSLVVVDLARLGQGDAVVHRRERVQSFEVPADGPGWVAYLLEEEDEDGDGPGEPGARRPGGGSRGGFAGRGGRGAGPSGGVDQEEGAPRTDDGSTLVALDPSTGSEARFENAVLFGFAEDGSALYFTTSKKADSLSTGDDLDGLFGVDRGDSDARPLITGEGRYLKLTVSEDGEKVAVLSDRDDRESEDPGFALYVAERGGVATAAATSSTPGIPNGWWIPEHGEVSFSDSGDRVFFGTAPRPDPKPEEEMDPDDEVVVDIWNWRDPLLQPMQLVQRDQELRRTYDAMLVDGAVIQLETEDLRDISFGDSKDLETGVASNGLPYRQEVSWTGRFADLVLVDAATGSRTVIAERVGGGRAQLSPQGRFVSWWDGGARAWMVWDIEEEQARNVTAALGVPVYNELDDHPAEPPPYGTAGWTEDDESLLVYDRFDIWAVDPTGRGTPRNVTEGVGRASDIRFRYVRPSEAGQGGAFSGFGGFGGGGDAQEAIPADEDVILSSFHLYTKRAGFYRDRFDRDREPERLVMEDAFFGRPQKAEDADVLLFTRETFRDFPNLHVSGMSFSDARLISDANPQQADYTWGTAELVSWNSNDGVPLQGVLYKPDDFDPSHQYPMMVYFYERNSDGLHRYTTPAAGSSSINRSFYVSRGYLLFVPDIPYIDGYPGESALDAVVPGVLAVANRGFVDRDKIGVQGHSWGGYQITYMVTRTDLFAAAEAGAPVSNMTSAYGGIRWQTGMSRAFQYETGQSRIGGSLWETPMRYIENSALFTADKINTPLLMMHNDEDGAVPWYQGIEMFSAMRRLQKPVWMLNYNGEPHGLRKKANQKDWAVRMQQFFDHYLKDAPPAVWMIEGVPAVKKGETLGLELLKKKTIS